MSESTMSEESAPKRRGWIWLVVIGVITSIIGIIVGSTKTGSLCGSVFNPKSLSAEIYDTLSGSYGGAEANCRESISAAAVPTWILIVLGIMLVVAGIIVRSIGNNRPTVVAAPAAPSVASQIEDLSRLKEQGLVSDEEFEAKRAELLCRL
ncbi:putative membrane protein [Arthrobacter sp. UYP6]|uniref:SHOCT domain-containing protein n=1 Tax=Arthrobacter sp. UYP6 TaxID=1756378 RepID=UPI003392B3ED